MDQIEADRPLASAELAEIDVIDADTHVVEPPDLWTSRMSRRWGDGVPHVRWDADTNEEVWIVGGNRVSAVGGSAMAGWTEYPPDHPRRWNDIDPIMWDAELRLKQMDRYGIYAHVLYPNVALFNTGDIRNIGDPEMVIACIEAYNDFQTDWSSVAPQRLVPMTVLPLWDLPASIREVARCANLGHRGLIFSQEPAYFGLPALVSSHWDPLWARAEEIGLPVNFHVATADLTPLEDARQAMTEEGAKQRALRASSAAQFFLGNAATISKLTCGGICHRFPRLNFVSVESGIGWIPFALESLDWQWKNYGVGVENPEYDLLPSEYFRRQIYGCFWFEQESAWSAIDQLGPDNFLYETDFPHPTSMTPGPATGAVAPNEYYASLFSELPASTTRKILHDNAARIYHLG